MLIIVLKVVVNKIIVYTILLFFCDIFVQRKNTTIHFITGTEDHLSYEFGNSEQ